MQGASVSGNLLVCPTPLRYDGYSGCEGRCLYCFAKGARKSSPAARRENFQDVKPLAMVAMSALSGKGPTDKASLSREGHALHIGGMADPFQPRERDARRTFDALEKCSAIDVPVICSTKFGLLREDPWRSAWQKVPRKLLQVSLIAADDRLRLVERGVPTWQERLEFLQDMASDGPTMIRLQPFIVGLSDSSLARVCGEAANAGVKAIVAEGFKVGMAMPRRVVEAIGNIIGPSFAPPNAQVGSDRAYSVPLQLSYQLQVRKLAHANGMHYYAADNAIRWLGDSAACCGTDLIGVPHCLANYGDLAWSLARGGAPASWSMFRAENSYILDTKRNQLNTGNGPKAREVLQRNRGEQANTFGLYAREWWSNPKSTNNPGRIVPFLRPVDFDAEGLPVWGFQLPDWAKRMLPDGWQEDTAPVA